MITLRFPRSSSESIRSDSAWKFSVTPTSEPQKVETFKFSDGALQVKVPELAVRMAAERTNEIVLEAQLGDSDSVLELILTVNAIRAVAPFARLKLVSKYLPYARQDRVMNPGEALALKVMCDIINGLNFTEVEVWDVHSDVSLALLDRVKHIKMKQLVQLVPKDIKNTVLVAPDAGAIKKTFDVAHGYGMEMVRADKNRDVTNGHITGTTVYSEHVGNKDFLIVDDICDGGRTFIELAKALRPLTNGKVKLYVTHGIFSKGLDVFQGLIDQIFVAVPFPDVDLNHPLIYQLQTERSFC